MDGPAKANTHAAKTTAHHNDHLKCVNAKTQRLERHSGSGHSLREVPKKGGRGGGTVWGSYEDDLDELKQDGVL